MMWRKNKVNYNFRSKSASVLSLVRVWRHHGQSFWFCGGLTLAGFQTPTQPLSPFASSKGRAENKMQKPVGQDKDWEITYQLQSRANQT